MSSIKESAERFFHACETGGGWDSCKEFCYAEATFSAQGNLSRPMRQMGVSN